MFIISGAIQDILKTMLDDIKKAEHGPRSNTLKGVIRRRRELLRRQVMRTRRRTTRNGTSDLQKPRMAGTANERLNERLDAREHGSEYYEETGWMNKARADGIQCQCTCCGSADISGEVSGRTGRGGKGTRVGYVSYENTRKAPMEVAGLPPNSHRLYPDQQEVFMQTSPGMCSFHQHTNKKDTKVSKQKPHSQSVEVFQKNFQKSSKQTHFAESALAKP